jgi:8-oxo-dGTP diphosphatase
MNQPATQVGIAVVAHAGRYLVGVRGANQVLAGRAEFPGGKCEPGESPRDCAERECREETGLAVVAERLLREVRFSYPHGDVVLFFWLCRPADAGMVAPDHRGYRWAAVDELASLPFPEANRSVLELLHGFRFGVDTQGEK